MEDTPVVSVYGSSRPLPGDPAYQQAETLGRLLAEAGYSVMTGGYAGTMEAASKGAKSAGGHVIGVTSAIFEGEGGRSGPNAYVDEVIRHSTLRDRLYHIVTRSDGAIALEGGVGTLSEVALTWSLIQVGEIPPMPFILVGENWSRLLAQFYGSGQYITQANMALCQFVRTPENAVALLQDWR